MKVFTRDYRITGGYHPVFEEYFSGLNPCILDIETTGLSYANSKVILVGLLTKTDNGVKITQFLAENHYEEHKVLDATTDFLKRENIGYLITYNGAAFDLPFLNTRLENNFSDNLIRLYDFDLLRFLKASTDIKSKTGSLRQVAVENYFGILEDRDDTITGRESVTLFDEYAISGNSVVEKIILTHNREDVLHLHRLMYHALNEADEYMGIEGALASYGFPIMDGRFSIKPSVSGKGRGKNKVYILKVNGDQLQCPVSAAFFPDIDNPISAEFNSETKMFQVEMPVELAPEDICGDKEICFLDTNTASIDVSGEPDCINGYLILNPRSINLAAKMIIESIIKKM